VIQIDKDASSEAKGIPIGDKKKKGRKEARREGPSISRGNVPGGAT